MRSRITMLEKRIDKLESRDGSLASVLDALPPAPRWTKREAAEDAQRLEAAYNAIAAANVDKLEVLRKEEREIVDYTYRAAEITTRFEITGNGDNDE